MSAEHVCVDCRKDPEIVASRRPRPIANPGGDEPPRCLTHLRRFSTRQRQLARGSHVERTYDISAADNGALLVFQGGRCWICGRATGASKALAVEHDHADDWVRGRLCSTCNQFIGRQLGDDPAKAQRLVEYLSGDTPYRRMLAARWIDARFGVQIPADRIKIQAEPTGDVTIWWLDSDNIWNANYGHTLAELKTYATPKGKRR